MSAGGCQFDCEQQCACGGEEGQQHPALQDNYLIIAGRLREVILLPCAAPVRLYLECNAQFWVP